jgi:ribonuclease D
MKKRKYQRPERTWEIVSDAAGLEQLCQDLRTAGRFAFDTEFIKEDRFEPIVCLLQAATDDRVVLIDPVSGELDLQRFWELVADDAVEVIVHAGAEDLALCYRNLGRPPKRVFDVQIAAGLVGYDYPLSLMRLVRSTLGVRLHKSQTLTDWQRRPLSDTQQRYAVDDVRYLPAIHHRLTTQLASLSRESWAAEEFQRFERAAAYEPEPKAALKRVRGTGSLDSRALAIAKELASEREALAKKLNRPVRAVLRDHLLVEIARRGWTEPQDIRSLRGISLNDRAIRQLGAAVKRAQARPAESLPPPPVVWEETPEESVVISLVTAVIRAHCLDHRLAYALVTNKQDIRVLVLSQLRGEAQGVVPALMNGWRREALGDLLDRVLSGAAGVRLEHTEDGPKLKFDESA